LSFSFLSFITVLLKVCLNTSSISIVCMLVTNAILRPHPRPPESEYLGIECRNLF
jgi:hypothetical protein